MSTDSSENESASSKESKSEETLDFDYDSEDGELKSVTEVQLMFGGESFSATVEKDYLSYIYTRSGGDGKCYRIWCEEDGIWSDFVPYSHRSSWGVLTTVYAPKLGEPSGDSAANARCRVCGLDLKDTQDVAFVFDVRKHQMVCECFPDSSASHVFHESCAKRWILLREWVTLTNNELGTRMFCPGGSEPTKERFLLKLEEMVENWVDSPEKDKYRHEDEEEHEEEMLGFTSFDGGESFGVGMVGLTGYVTLLGQDPFVAPEPIEEEDLKKVSDISYYKRMCVYILVEKKVTAQHVLALKEKDQEVASVQKQRDDAQDKLENEV